MSSADRNIRFIAAHHDLLAAADNLAVAYAGIEVGTAAAPAHCRHFFDVVGNLHKTLGACK